MMEQLQEDDAEEDAGVVNNAEFSSSTSKSSVFLNAACAITNTILTSQSATPPEYSPSRGSRTVAQSSLPPARSLLSPARSKRRGRLPFFFSNNTRLVAEEDDEDGDSNSDLDVGVCDVNWICSWVCNGVKDGGERDFDGGFD
ncbi:hypothetical protein ACFXTH_028040 [Malus domestica]